MLSMMAPSWLPSPVPGGAMLALPVKVTKSTAASAPPHLLHKGHRDPVYQTLKKEEDKGHAYTVGYELGMCHLKKQVQY